MTVGRESQLGGRRIVGSFAAAGLAELFHAKEYDRQKMQHLKKVELQNTIVVPFCLLIAIMAAGLNAISKWAVPVFLAVSLGQAAMYDVKGGTRAVIFDRLSGVQEQVVNEGTHFLIPWLQKSIIYDVRTKPRNISTTTGSKDLQMVSLTLRVLHRPEVQKLPKIYQVYITHYYP
jgi:hypothetical protein